MRYLAAGDRCTRERFLGHPAALYQIGYTLVTPAPYAVTNFLVRKKAQQIAKQDVIGAPASVST